MAQVATAKVTPQERARGAYATPLPLVRYLYERTVAPWITSQGDMPRILDPACGEGAFLAPIARWLIETRPGFGASERTRLVQRTLFGVELDEATTIAARRRVAAAAGVDPEALTGNIVQGDSLDGAVEKLGAPFDVVLTNPPWLSYSGRHAKPLSPATRSRYREIYGPGWLTSHGLFTKLAVTRWASQAVGLVLPDQVGHLAGYASLRDTISAAMSIHDVRSWGEAVFPQAITPVLTLVARRNGAGRADPWSSAPPRRMSPDRKPQAQTTMSSAVDSPAWPDAIRNQCGTLGKLVADPGVHTGNCAAMLIADEPMPEGVWEPVLEGRQISRYQCLPAKRVLRMDLDAAALSDAGQKRYFRIARESRFRSAAWLIRQTANRVIAGPRLGTLYFRNSLLALYSPDDGHDVRYLAGLLNSTLLSWLYQQQVREAAQQTFPQVKIRALRALPIRWLNLTDPSQRGAHDRIVNLVDQRLASLADEQPVLDQQIDTCVMDLYEVPEAWRSRIIVR